MNDELNVPSLSNVPGGGDLTEKEVASAIRQLVHRKTYNLRPDVRAKRKEYNRRRQQTIRQALQAYRKQQEGGVV